MTQIFGDPSSDDKSTSRISQDPRSNSVFRQLCFFGVIAPFPSLYSRSRKIYPKFCGFLGYFLVVLSWIVVLCDALLNVWKADSKSSLLNQNAEAEVSQSELITMIFSLRVLFRRAGTTILFTVAVWKRRPLTKALESVIDCVLSRPASGTSKRINKIILVG